MSIISSSADLFQPQADGRRWIIERHTDHLGVVRERGPYLADASYDPDGDLASRAAEMNAALAAGELSRDVAEIAEVETPRVSTEFCTRAQLAARLREAFMAARGVRALRIGAYIDANLTDAQLKTLFSLTNAQVTALRTKLDDMAARLAAVNSEVGQ